jgi:hypothetical protein
MQPEHTVSGARNIQGGSPLRLAGSESRLAAFEHGCGSCRQDSVLVSIGVGVYLGQVDGGWQNLSNLNQSKTGCTRSANRASWGGQQQFSALMQ